MDRLEKRFEHLSNAVGNFDQALRQYKKWQTVINPEKTELLGIDHEGIVNNLHDSMVQRFEYSIDLLWKYIKSYLDEKLNIFPDVLSPDNVIRQAGKARLLSENDTKIMLEMIKKRNLISHIYHEEIAQILSSVLPMYLTTMQKILDNIKA